MTALHPAEVAYREVERQAHADLAEARRKRVEAIRRELASGKTIRQVAAEFGKSYGRIQQLARD